jgi:hypothetical protein
MAENLFPSRQRCKTCGKGFKTHVLSGLYCSYKCANHPVPTTDPSKAPRECAYQRDGKFVFKRKFRCEQEIPDTIMSKPDVSVYRCKHCLYIHTGTAVARSVKEQKSIGSMAELSEVLVKMRGKATRTTVGKVAGVRPIRIKEIEEGADRIDPEALFALLKLYRINLSVGFR